MGQKLYRKVVVLDSVIFFPEHRQRLEAIADEVIEYNTCTSEEEVSQRCKGADCIISCWVNIPRRVIEENPQLRTIAFWTHDYEHRIDAPFARARGIHIPAIPDYGTDSVAELVFVALLNMPTGNSNGRHTSDAVVARLADDIRLFGKNVKDTVDGRWLHEYIKTGQRRLSHPDEIPEETLMKVLVRPALVEVWDERFFYFVAKFEMNFIDTAKKAACLSTVQIDVENTERFNINYTAEDGTKQHPLLMHTSVSGSLDRNVYAILENQAMRLSRGEKAFWPAWLAPIQVRLLPVAEAQIEGALKLVDQIPYRVDVDDRHEKLGKKVRDAEREWIPYVIVVGDKELSGGDLTIRPRIGDQITMPLNDFLEKIAAETAGKPIGAANTPRRLSKRPIFVG